MKIVRIFLMIIGAGATAVAVLSVALCFYSLTPVHIENSNGNTDYVWPSNAVWVKMTEGIAWGRYDANGFNNKTVIENPDIIILGSSHMEATNVMQDQNVCHLLNEMFDGELSVYNMGISGHDFFKVCQYLPANLELYGSSLKAVIIETGTVKIANDNVDEVLESSVEFTPSHATGLIGMLHRIPFIRLVYRQVEGGLLNLFMQKNHSASSIVVTDDKKEIKAVTLLDQDAYNKLFNYLMSLKEKYDKEILIFYHPIETIQEDGTIAFERDEFLSAFSLTAENHGIIFIDMTASFEKMYHATHHVAHGFSTGKIGTGHLNAYGHLAVAKSLYETIEALKIKGKHVND